MALASMTGFARASGVAGAYALAFEMRSVNGRGLDMRFRLPAPFDGLEQDLRTRAQKRLARGTVQIGLTIRRESPAGTVRINEQTFLDVAAQAEKLAWMANLAAATVGDLLRVPGILESGPVEPEALDEAARAATFACFDAALEGLIAARHSEGAALKDVVLQQIDAMQRGIAAAEAADAARPAAIKARLRTQIAALMDSADGLDPQRLHQEAALIAARVDIREEIDRFRAHVDAARALVNAAEPVGRKLDFLTQEFVREANTLCSKANDIALTRVGLDLKALVEQFREQIQNIE
ncbi:MAG TPA: YicC family protein [Beijerinckiaceae bacterium]|nr:YicC family protein [Beijerinckiaceae bacterium]